MCRPPPPAPCRRVGRTQHDFAMRAFRKVLCAVDVGDGPGPFLGEVAEEVLRAADREARLHQAELVAIHAIPTLGAPMSPAAFEETLLRRQTLATTVFERLTKALEQVSGRKSDEVALLVEDGPPARAILDAAERIGANLIVLGNSGAKGQRRLLLGSTAVEVVRDAKGAVLVIRLP